jgi:hypothetical protein
MPCSQQKTQKQERVAILLPWSSSKLKAALVEDGQLQVGGIIDFITKNEDKTGKANFVFIDHKNDTTIAKTKVQEELHKGTKYFYSTMSAVNEDISLLC